MKIGLITYYGDLNCGTALQAYSTLCAIKQTFPKDEVEIVPFHGFNPKPMPYKTYNPYYIWQDVKRFRKYYQFKKDSLGIEKDCIIKDVNNALAYINSKKYDLIFVGADTLLELDRVPAGYDGISAYWLKDVDAKKAMIAASARNVTYDKLTDIQRKDLKIAAKQFNYIGVRDRATKQLIESLLESGKQVERIPDPTFTLDIDYSLTEKYLKSKRIEIPQKSVFIQFFGDDYWLDEVVADLKKKGYTIVTNRNVKWSDIILIDMSPLEQLGIYRHFEFVITHRFHDGVFCLKNKIPFVIYVKSAADLMTGGESTHVSLVKDFGLYPEAYLGALDEGKLNNVWESICKVKKIFDLEKVEKQLSQNKRIYFDYLHKIKESIN